LSTVFVDSVGFRPREIELDEVDEDEQSVASEESVQSEPLCPHGQEWKDTGDVLVDKAAQVSYFTNLKFSRLLGYGIRTEMEYFDLMFPTQM